METQGRVLLVDDEPEMLSLLAAGLGKRGFVTASRTSAREAFALLASEDFDAVVSDLRMKDMDGLVLCQRIAASFPGLPVIVITAFGSLDTAVAAIRAGAYDFVTKPLEIETLQLALERAIAHRRLSQEVIRLRHAPQTPPAAILGESEAMRKVFDLIDRVAETDASVLITGESGTGKELVARAIHERSRRRAGPFVAINSAAMPETLLESELFGHARGAFTDARQARAGLFVQASGGTLFLDEIGEMPLGLQSKLLRALQERKVRPVGADHEVAFDARLVTATHRDLEAAIDDGRFREDLYYRIHVVRIHVPPLRERGRDILLLAQAFLQRSATAFGKPVTQLSPAAAERLLGYAWPGNVRELANAMESAVALARFAEIGVEDLPEKIRAYRASHVVVSAERPDELIPMEEVEKRYILHVLAAVGGSRTVAAQKLGFDRKTLYRKLKAYGVADE